MRNGGFGNVAQRHAEQRRPRRLLARVQQRDGKIYHLAICHDLRNNLAREHIALAHCAAHQSGRLQRSPQPRHELMFDGLPAGAPLESLLLRAPLRLQDAIHVGHMAASRARV